MPAARRAATRTARKRRPGSPGPGPGCRLRPWAALGVLLLLAAAPGCTAPRGVPVRELDLLALPWEAVSFGGEGRVHREGSALVLEPGSPLTAVRWPDLAGLLDPALPFEVELEAERLQGTDFFCALTLPVGGEHATVVLGGWGGALCGLSCVDGRDASENPTRTFRGFRRGQRVRLVVRVGEDAVEAWLDGAPLLRQERAGHRFEVRTELLAARPLGVATFATRARLHRMVLRAPGPSDAGGNGFGPGEDPGDDPGAQGP